MGLKDLRGNSFRNGVYRNADDGELYRVEKEGGEWTARGKSGSRSPIISEKGVPISLRLPGSVGDGAFQYVPVKSVRKRAEALRGKLSVLDGV